MSNRKAEYILNQMRGWIAYGLRQERIPEMQPDIMQMETISLCNLHCVFCPYPKMNRKHEIMNLELAKQLIDEQFGHISNLGLHHFGEPFLDPNISKIIEFCNNLGIKTTISTNANKITFEKAKSVLAAGLSRIIISVDAAQEDTYRALRKKGSLRKVYEGVKDLVKAKKDLDSNCYIQVQFISTPENLNEEDDFINFWLDKEGIDQVVVRKERTHAGQVIRHDKYSKRSVERQPCRYLWESLVILANGDVTICCKDYDGKAVIGNVFTGEKLSDLWNNKKMIDLRKKHIEGNLAGTMCENCHEWCGHAQMSEMESSKAFIFHREQKKQNRESKTHSKLYVGEYES